MQTVNDTLPNNFSRIELDQKFCFDCHPGVPCFTECCRELDLALTPYDVLRLKRQLKLQSGIFLEKYVIIEWDEQQLFPICYLTMVDDGRASCVFVDKSGCKVYDNRPGSCRAYPVGRGAIRKADGTVDESFVLVTEDHCKGFAEGKEQDVNIYFADQELETYNHFNDKLLELYQHDKIRAGFKPTRAQLDQYILALYNLDTFSQQMANDSISMKRPLTPMELQGLAGDDEKLLLLAISWLKQEFFGE